jgi:hypothetical protein
MHDVVRVASAIFALAACALPGCTTRLLDVSDLGDLASSAPAVDQMNSSVDLAGECVVPAGPNARIDGTTPLGEFHGRYSWAVFVFECGCRGLDQIEITETDHVSLRDSRVTALEIEFGSLDATGPQPIGVQLRVGNQMAATTAMVDITAIDVPATTDENATNGSASGTLAVDAPGWQLVGTFTAIRCPGYFAACLC